MVKKLTIRQIRTIVRTGFGSGGTVESAVREAAACRSARRGGCDGEAIGGLTNRRTLFNTEKAKESMQPVWICSADKAKAELGFRQNVTLGEGMRSTYAWYRRRGRM